METLKIFKHDSKGLAISLDILLALIPLTILLGLVAANMGNIMYETQDTLYRSSIERAAADTTNALLETSGDPYNWETNPSQLKVVGLAKYDPTNNLPIEYVLTPEKLGSVTPSQIQNILGSQYGFSLTIRTLNDGVLGNVIRNMTSNGNTGHDMNHASDVVKVERNVIVSAFDIVADFRNIRLTRKPQTLTKQFPTSTAYLEAYDYYVYVTDSDSVSSGWVRVNYVHQPHSVIESNDFPSTPPLVVKIDPVANKLKNETDLQMNTVQTYLAGSPGDVASVYVLQVPKGTSLDQISLYGPNRVSARYELYVWT